MSQSTILRAAGAYADEVAKHLGLLTLKAAVLAGLRIQDGNKYAPDDRLIPQDPDRLHWQLRDAWLEYDSLGTDLGSFLEDREQIAINLHQMAQTHCWADALALAAVAAELRQWDPLAQITLAANCLRRDLVDRAEHAIRRVEEELTFPYPSISARVFRHRAGIEEKRGHPDGAAALARLASIADPDCQVSRLDFFAYEEKLYPVC